MHGGSGSRTEWEWIRTPATLQPAANATRDCYLAVHSHHHTMSAFRPRRMGIGDSRGAEFLSEDPSPHLKHLRQRLRHWSANFGTSLYLFGAGQRKCHCLTDSRVEGASYHRIVADAGMYLVRQPYCVNPCLMNGQPPPLRSRGLR